MSKTTVTCPNGHESVATDYCDVCGEPMAQGAASSPPAPPPPAAPPATAASILDLGAAPAAPVICKNCHAENLPASLFCEDCGYDFASGQLPPPPAEPAAPAAPRFCSQCGTAAPAGARFCAHCAAPLPA